MAFCPKCRGEYRPEITHCPVCDVDLVAAEDLPPRLTDEEVVALLRDAELVVLAEGTLAGLKPVQEDLIARGIPAALRKAEEMMTEMGLFLRLDLVVRKEDEARAAPLVRAALAGDISDEMREGLEASFGSEAPSEEEADPETAPESLACPACGCTDPLVDGECPECGLFLGEEDPEAPQEGADGLAEEAEAGDSEARDRDDG